MIAHHKGDPKKQHRIINIASAAALRAIPELGVYGISKAAVVHMTKTMAVEWGRFGINVNAICPGYIGTEMNLEFFRSEQGGELLESLPRKRIGKPEDLDGLLLLLAAEESHFINGAIVSADDGISVC
jgi:NAD(P)-dependent dehydrogenase (short-subunit alcohol dehydrogenase family)